MLMHVFAGAWPSYSELDDSVSADVYRPGTMLALTASCRYKY